MAIKQTKQRQKANELQSTQSVFRKQLSSILHLTIRMDFLRKKGQFQL